jgi:CheY-like chemotaxis protein
MSPTGPNAAVPARILIADADETSRHLLRAQLGMRGHAVTSCGSGADALRGLETPRDLLLLSDRLPDMRGSELLDGIRTAHPAMGIILVSDRGDEERVIRALERGADDYLTRPLRPALMLARVQAVLAMASSRESTERPAFLDLPSIDRQLRQARGGRAKLHAICDILRDGLHAERASVFRYDRTANELLTVVAHGDEGTDEPLIRMPADSGLAGAAIVSGKLLNVPDAYADDRFNPKFDVQTGFQTQSVLCVPLRDQHDELVGVAQVLNHENGPFPAVCEVVSRQLASRCAAALSEAFYADAAAHGLHLAATIAEMPAGLGFETTAALSGSGSTTDLLDDAIAPTDPESFVGTSIGRYQVLSVLGQGSQGVVLEGKDEFLERQVAIKILGRDSARFAPMRDQFMREARSMARLVHPNTVAVHDAGEHDGALFLVMEKCSAGTALARMRSLSGALDLLEATTITRDACRGLDAAHRRGMIHRDIKPDNILIGEHNAKLSDFGLVLAANAATEHGQGRIVGTPHYMSPEQCRGDAIDHRSDLYALGATFFHLVTGQAPFHRLKDVQDVMRAHRDDELRDPRSLKPDLPLEVSLLIATAMAKNPDDRFQSAVEMLDDLDALCHLARMRP